MKFKVKVISELFDHKNVRRRPDDRNPYYDIEDPKRFSPVSMKAIGWTPGDASEGEKIILDSPEHKNKFVKHLPFDEVTHGKHNKHRVPKSEDGEEEGETQAEEAEEEAVEQEAEAKTKKAKGKAKDVI